MTRTSKVRWLVMLVLGVLFAGCSQGPSEGALGLNVLVATPDESRGDNYARFFKARGMASRIRPYDGVSPADLDWCDVIVADTPSGTFRDAYGVIRTVDVRTFPKTDKPIFGVGLLGNKLLKRYEIAASMVKT